jgi:hypothetical protein
MSTPLTGTFDEVNGHEGGNIRKLLRMAVFIAPESAPAITSLVDNTNELVIPDTYESIGVLAKENPLSATPTITSSEVMGYGYATALRRDQVNRTNALAFTMLETRRAALELYYGVDLANVKATPTAGGKNEFTFDEPDRPETMYWRVLTVGVDGDGAGTIYIGDFYPRATVTDVAALTASETDARSYSVTMGTDTDTTIGTSHRPFFAGPGVTTDLLTKMGITRATA